MAYGPVELVIIKFPGNEFTGEIAPALEDLIANGTVRIIDLLFVIKDVDGVVGVVELESLSEAVISVYAPISQHDDELLSMSDGEYIGEALEPNSSAIMILFENAWAARFATAVRNANGEVLLNERIPRAVIDEVLAEAAQELLG
ncbi:MAG: hypothetical protein KF883_01535 [Thermomicrobiales bacterium]|nr:hypothetical protein [Thermomicrobiales bacterium]